MIDPYQNQKRYENWIKNKKIDGISSFNSKIIINYIEDMEKGLNVSSRVKKGSRSYSRLITLKNRMTFLAKQFEKLGTKKLPHLKEEEVITFFNDMRKGKIKKNNGKAFISTADYVKVFKAFWHWHMKKSRKQGKVIEDITAELDSTYDRKPDFVYFKIKDMNRLAERSKYEYKVLMYFLFDSGIRSPTELMNIKVNDLSKLKNSDDYQLEIRDEISKTFGRKIKLLLCSKLIKNYIKDKGLKKDDYLFPIVPRVINQYLKRIGEKVLGKDKTLGGKSGKELTMYDFRHSSACYWLPRYQSESALKYRFGWKKSDQIHYYTDMLGMKDTITEEDLLIDFTKTQIEQELLKEKKQREMLQEQLGVLNSDMKQTNSIISKLVRGLIKKGKMSDVIDVVHKQGLIKDLKKLR